MLTKLSYCSLLFTILLLVTSCQATQSAFARTTNNAGSAFAAASLTLTYAHQGKVTTAYAMSTFMNYQSELSNVDQQLSGQPGAPSTHAIQQLLAVYKDAIQVINQPCLDMSCQWRSQVVALDRASQAFLKAGDQ